MKLRGLAQVALASALAATPLVAEKGCCSSGGCCGKESGCCAKASEKCAKDNAKCLAEAMNQCCGKKAVAKKAKATDEVASVDSQLLFEIYKQQLTSQPK